MNIPINILRHYLRDVYFLCGTACGGKTTISKALAERHSLLWLGEDELNAEMLRVAAPAHQPAWCSRPADWEAYFNRPYREFAQWLDDCIAEQVPLMVLELIKRCAERPVAVDLPFAVRTAMELAAPDHLVFLVTAPEIMARNYFNRPGHSEILDEIMRLRDPQKALANTHRTLEYMTQKTLDEVRQSGAPWVMRNERSTVEGTLAQVEQIFQLPQPQK